MGFARCTVASASDLESTGPSSIQGGGVSNFFSPFFLPEVKKLFFLFIPKSNDISTISRNVIVCHINMI